MASPFLKETFDGFIPNDTQKSLPVVIGVLDDDDPFSPPYQDFV